MSMLLSGRVNAIIEYSAVIDTNIKERKLAETLDKSKKRIASKEVRGFAHGYIACAKNTGG